MSNSKRAQDIKRKRAHMSKFDRSHRERSNYFKESNSTKHFEEAPVLTKAMIMAQTMALPPARRTRNAGKDKV